MSNKTVFSVSEIKEGRIGIDSTQSVRRELKERKATTQKLKNKIVVDLSELLRVYQPEELDFDLLTGKTKAKEANSNLAVISTSTENTVSSNVRVLEERINSRDKEIELLEKQLDREREIADDIKEALKQSQNHETRLLEYQKHREGEGTNLEEILKPLQVEKDDLAKANIVYAGLAFITITAAIIFALIQEGILQFN